MTSQFQYLFTPLQIGSLEVRNRIVCLPHGTGFGVGGIPGDRMVHYLADRAKGGAGLIVMSGFYVHPTGDSGGTSFPAYDAERIPSYKAVAEAVHEHGARILGQIYHYGRQGTSFFSRRHLWAMSPIPCPGFEETPHEMSRAEIQLLVRNFAMSAANLVGACFDGVEIHAGHGYLLQQAMSPWSNHRTDDYGGDVENRLRLLEEVIEAIRAEIGPCPVFGVRISADEMVDGGLSLDDMSEVARRLEASGRIDYISVSFGAGGGRQTQDMSWPPGAMIYLAARIRETVDLPVIAAQRINDPFLAEKILADGHADLVGMARALICDPELPNKAREGRLEDIRACMACCQECRRTAKGGSIGCTQNPAVGEEKDLGIGTLRPADKRKKVVVVGGGPAGLEAARVAAERGHHVTLYEKENRLGGQVNIAARAPTREEIGAVVRYLTTQVEKLGVRVQLGVEASVDTVLKEEPDAVVVATGSVPLSHTLEGAHDMRVVSVWDVLEEKVEVGQRIVVVDGGQSFWPCCSAAEYLASQGKQVEIISPSMYVGMEIPAESMEGLYRRLARGGVVLSPSTAIKRAQGRSLVCSHGFSGQEREISGVDTVVMVVGNRARNELYSSLDGKVKELYAIGDCLAPRKIPEAIREGHLAGRAL